MFEHYKKRFFSDIKHRRRWQHGLKGSVSKMAHTFYIHILKLNLSRTKQDIGINSSSHWWFATTYRWDPSYVHRTHHLLIPEKILGLCHLWDRSFLPNKREKKHKNTISSVLESGTKVFLMLFIGSERGKTKIFFNFITLGSETYKIKDV